MTKTYIYLLNPEKKKEILFGLELRKFYIYIVAQYSIVYTSHAHVYTVWEKGAWGWCICAPLRHMTWPKNHREDSRFSDMVVPPCRIRSVSCFPTFFISPHHPHFFLMFTFTPAFLERSAAAQALEKGCTAPWNHIVFVGNHSSFVLLLGVW